MLYNFSKSASRCCHSFQTWLNDVHVFRVILSLSGSLLRSGVRSHRERERDRVTHVVFLNARKEGKERRGRVTRNTCDARARTFTRLVQTINCLTSVTNTVRNLSARETAPRSFAFLSYISFKSLCLLWIVLKFLKLFKSFANANVHPRLILGCSKMSDRSLILIRTVPWNLDSINFSITMIYSNWLAISKSINCPADLWWKNIEWRNVPRKMLPSRDFISIHLKNMSAGLLLQFSWELRKLNTRYPCSTIHNFAQHTSLQEKSRF